jgi:hypothetical protein
MCWWVGVQKNIFKNKKNMFSTISALGIARQHSKVSHDSNNSKSRDITKFGHFGVPKTTLNVDVGVSFLNFILVFVCTYGASSIVSQVC